jgi:hypothetical protein
MGLKPADPLETSFTIRRMGLFFLSIIGKIESMGKLFENSRKGLG